MSSIAEAVRTGKLDREPSNDQVRVNPEMFWVFHGQGAQEPGMTADLYNTSIRARAAIDAGDAWLLPKLGFSIRELMHDPSDTPEHRQRLAEYSSEVTTISNIAYHIHLLETGMEGFDGFARQASGSSVGLFSTFPAYGIVRYEDTVDLVYERNRGIRYANSRHPGKMLRVPLPADDPRIVGVQELGDTWVALENHSRQTILSIAEHKAELVASWLEDKLDEEERELLLMLPTSGGFHSPLMGDAVPYLERVIDNTDFHDPFVPGLQLIANTDGKVIPLTGGPRKIKQRIKDETLKQITHTVKFIDVVNRAIREGATTQAEPGDKAIVHGLSRREHGGETQRHLLHAAEGAAALGVAATLLYFAEEEIRHLMKRRRS